MSKSTLSGFYRLDVAERRRRIAEICGLSEEQMLVLSGDAGLSDREADKMIENALGVIGIPLGVCVNLLVDGKDVLVPMAVEEPSVLAASSFAAKLLRAGGGLTTEVSAPHMIGQVQLLDVPDAEAAKKAILAERDTLIIAANSRHKNLVKAGGGAIDIELHELPPAGADDPLGPMLVVHLVVDVRDAMGANAINSMCERLAPRLAELSGGRAGLRILSNLSDRRTVTVTGKVPFKVLEGRGKKSGEALAKAIEEASVFAERDPYRAATHNKGVMNGVDAVLLAFGQDWRAVEAGAHAFAARNGRYTALARWRAESDHLLGVMELPLAVGTVGGVAKVHPTVRITREMANIKGAGQLASLVASVGLAQNLAALRALAAEGIQSGHMRLHARNVATEAGATGGDVHKVAAMIADRGLVNLDGAKAALEEVRCVAEPVDVKTRFAQLKNDFLPQVEKLLDEVTSQEDEYLSLREMSAYHFSTGGKRLRALLPLMVAEAVDEEPQRMLPFGAACEMLHNATLVHDDLQDGDEVRRSKATIWKKYGQAQAINLGDAMFYWTLLLEQQLDVPPIRREAAARRILVETLRVIDGQEREFQLKTQKDAGLAGYFKMVEGKTSGLFALPLAGAAEVLGAGRPVVQALAEAARHLGVLFQIQDDVLDIFGDKGRQIKGSDIAEGKRSALVMHALENADAADRKFLEEVLDRPREQTTEADIAAVAELMQRVGSLKYTLDEMQRRKLAAVQVQGLEGQERLRCLIAGLADLFLEPIAPLVDGGEPPALDAKTQKEDLEFCRQILPRVSRTFALSISALPEELGASVGIAYLLCRVVDTIEDDATVRGAPRVEAFDRFDALMQDDTKNPGWLTEHATATDLGENESEKALLAESARVFRAFRSIAQPQRDIVRRSVLTMSKGMREYAARADAVGQLRLSDLEDLERYCYFVAGTVGELLTGLFEHEIGGLDEERRAVVHEHAIAFGLGLQLVNIVKDVASDFERGDCFLPESLARAHGITLNDILAPKRRPEALSVVSAVAERAREHLERAAIYTVAWPADKGRAIREFCAVPLGLAVASLAEVEQSQDTLRPGHVPKVSRETVRKTFDCVMKNAHDDAALTAMFVELAGASDEHPSAEIHVPKRPPVPQNPRLAASAEELAQSEQGEDMSESSERPERIIDGKILVTGASGHLGANLVRRLVEDGADVRVLLRSESDNAAVDGVNVEKIYGDLREWDDVKKAMEGIRGVYHVAALVSTLEGTPTLKRDIYDTNVLGTRNILRAAREENVIRTVVTGSFSAVGYHLDDPSKPADESMPIYPFDRKLPYARTKEMVEHEVLKAHADGQDVVIATSCAILGPNDYKPSRMGRTLIDYAQGKLRAYIAGGFEFVASRDIVQGHVLAMKHGRSGQKYVFSTQYLSMDDIMDIFEEVTGQPRPKLKLPASVMARVADVSSYVMGKFFPSRPQRFTPGAVRILRQQRRADLTKSKTELGYQPGSARQAVHEAYADFARRGLVAAAPSERAQEGTTSTPASKSDTAAA